MLARTLVQLAENLVDNFDVVDTLTLLVDRCVEVLEVTSAGLMLAGPTGALRLAASSSDAMRVVELFELQANEGPCLDCYRSGEALINQELALVQRRWPQFAPVALAAGYQSVHAVPMRLRGAMVGAINLFRSDAIPLEASDVLAAQALADMGTIAILQQRASREAQTLNEQLTQALNSRVLIEQAKGVLAERADLNMEQSFSLLRGYARSQQRRLLEVAQGVINGTVTIPSPNRPRRPADS